MEEWQPADPESEQPAARAPGRSVRVRHGADKKAGAAGAGGAGGQGRAEGWGGGEPSLYASFRIVKL